MTASGTGLLPGPSAGNHEEPPPTRRRGDTLKRPNMSDIFKGVPTYVGHIFGEVPAYSWS